MIKTLENGIVGKTLKTFLSESFKNNAERFILRLAIVSYLIHLGLILAASYNLLPFEFHFLKNPISAIYTPFSFILIYEVYLLVFFLPKSISSYIGKQYEIITLIVIRRIFKDISKIELTSDWFNSKSDLQFTYDVFTSLILFGLIFLFYRNIKKRSNTFKQEGSSGEEIRRFIRLKRTLASLLTPTLFILAIISFSTWAINSITDYSQGTLDFSNLNNIFFDEFFTILITVDVLLLLASFFYSDEFHTIIRNSGFVISTILIKVSFSTEGIVNDLLIIGGVLFGFLILLVYNKYEEHRIST